MTDPQTTKEELEGDVMVCAGCGIHSDLVEWGTIKCKECENQ